MFKIGIRLQLVAALFSLGAVALGDTPAPAGGVSNNAPRSAPGGSGPSTVTFPRGIQVFDDRVFELGVDKPANPTSPSGRALGSEPDYNTEQRQRWMSNCSEASERGSKSYKECFDRQKSNTESELRGLRGTGEGKSMEMRNQAPLDSAPQDREPAFKDVEIDRSNE